MPSSRPNMSFALSLIALAAVPLALAARDENPYCAIPQDQLDPAEDLCNPLRYLPHKAVNAVAAALYFAAAIAFTWNQFKFKGKYFLCLLIGTYTEALGIVLRIVFRSNTHSLGLYIIMYMLVILSPCAFLAADYILLGRIVNHLNGARHFPINPGRVSWFFIISDICTFLIQASGGGMSAAGGNLHDIGTKIFLAGLIIQLASFFTFSCFWILFLYRVKKNDPLIWNHPGWKPLYFALGWTCIMFLIRSVFRTIELSEGYAGYLTTHEPYYLALDCLPLWLGIVVYTWFWPPRILTEETRVPRSTVSSDDGYDAPLEDMSNTSTEKK